MVWSEEKRMVWLFELTVCYKLNTEDTEQGRLRNTMTDHMNLGTEVTHVTSIQFKLDQEAISTQAALNLWEILLALLWEWISASCVTSPVAFDNLTNGKLLFAILVPDSLIIYIICLPSLYHPLVLPFHTLSTWIGDHDPTSRQFSPSVPLLCHALLCMHEYITGIHVIYIIIPHSGKFSNGASFV